jgi:hypothetical protein
MPNTVNPLNNPAVGGLVTSNQAQANYLWNQPNFDPRVYRIGQAFAGGVGSTGAPVFRGYMSWDPNVTWVDPYSGNQTWTGAPKVYFLYNPSTISASYQIDQTNGAQASMMFPVSNSGGNLVMPLQQTLGFTLMFDRTYEIWAGNNAAINNLGCEVDVIAMKQFTGMFTTAAQNLNNSSGSSANNNNPYSIDTSSESALTVNTANPNQGGLLQGMMTYVQSYFFFSNPPTGLMYYGVVNNFDVQYTHFAQDMRPMRCVIDVSVNLLPPVGAASGNAAKNSATTQAAANNAGVGPTGRNQTGLGTAPQVTPGG